MDSALARELHRLLSLAGDLAMRHFREAKPEHKRDGSLVTAGDRAVEALIVEGLERAFPEDGIVAEEGTRVEPKANGGVWHVDPIDGTSAFVGGLAYWGPTICRVRDGELEVGAFYVPRLDEFWYAAKGQGAWRNEERLQPDLNAAVGPESILLAPSRFHLAGPVPWPGKVRALGSGAAHLALVASGGGVLTAMPSWALWDVGCGVLLVRETGLVIRDLSGAPVVPEAETPGTPFLAGTESALRILTADDWAASVLRRRRRRET
ncbi:MAG: inositol monophosphatase family protein [Myxococcota bacterium]